MPNLTATAEVLDELRRLGRIAATTREAAVILDTTEREVIAFLAGSPQARAAFEAERAGAKVSSQRRQFRSNAPVDMLATARRLNLFPAGGRS